MSLQKSLEAAVEILEQSDALLITAGAGIGVDSGLPDFRGNKGFWKAYPPIARLGISFVEMANPQWFDHNPRLAWAFYGHRLNLYRKTVPHQGFTQLLEMARRKQGGYFVYTSNVDGQFQKAGYDGDSIEECHGSIHHFQCAGPCCNDIWDAGGTPVAVDEERFEALDPLPLCGHCGGIARPNILMFGDWSWHAHRTSSQGAMLTGWLRHLASENMQLAVIEAGAGQAVPTVRHRSEYVAGAHQARLIRINPRDFQVPGKSHVSLPLGAQEGINAIFELYKKN